MGRIKACVCLRVDVGRGREWLVLRSFLERFAVGVGSRLSILGRKGLCQDGVGEGRAWGEMGRASSAQCLGICISLREPSATAMEQSALKVEITQQGTHIKMLSSYFSPLLSKELWGKEASGLI